MFPRVPRSRIRPAVLLALLAAGLVSAAAASAQTFTWSRWEFPAPRYDHVAIYDPVRDRMIVQGGRTVGEPDYGDTGETWSLRFDVAPRWELLDSGPTRSRGEAMYDPTADRMVSGGGWRDGPDVGYTQMLALDSGAWSFCCSGSAPQPGPDNVAVFDELRNRWLVISYTKVLQLDLATGAWSMLSTVGELTQFAVMVAHDVVRDRLIVRTFDGMFQLTLSGTPTWSQLWTAGTPSPYDARNDLFFDALRDRLLEVGADGNVWALSMDATPTWTSIANPPLPTGMHNPQIVHDAERDRLLWFGSATWTTATNDTWAFRLETATWQQVHPGGPIPARAMHSAVAAPPWDALVVFGGSSNSTIRLPMTGFGPSVEVAADGPKPAARRGHAAIYDPVRQRMIVFGGNDGTQLLNDAHALSIGANPTWSPLFTQNSPPPVRELAHAIYDPVRDRMVMLGGAAGSTIYRDVLALSLGPTPTWSQLAPGTALPALGYSDLVYDSQRDRLIAITQIGPDTRTWWMPAGGPYTWTEFGVPVSAMRNFAAAYDPAGDRVLLHGGYRPSPPFPEEVYVPLFAINPGTGQWSVVSSGLPSGRARLDHTLTRDPGRERFVLVGGVEQSPYLPAYYDAYPGATVWFAKDPQTVLDVGPPAVAAGTLAIRRVWLAAPDRIAYELVGLREGTAAVEAFDVAGRRLGASVLPTGASPARSGEIRIAAAARSGIVIVSARQAGAPAAVRRLAVLR